MKKLFGVLTAAAMLCCTLVSPVSAEETYQMGDVNMDGVVDTADAQLVLNEYVYALVGRELTLTDEQMQLAAIVGQSTDVSHSDETIPFSALDSQVIKLYYADTLCMKVPEDEDVVTYYSKLKEYVS